MKIRSRRSSDHPFLWLASRLALGLGCLLLVVPSGRSAPASPAGEKASAPLTTDDGFTRETLLEFDNPPEPRLLAPAPTATIDDSAADGSHMVLHHHHRRHHPEQTNEDHQPVVVAKPSHHRNPVQSFIYWWNGWVIRNFHTRNGTVLLDSVGAKT